MTLGELFGLEAKLPAASARVPITGLAADSREVKPGYLFAALPGVKTDGTRFIARSLGAGRGGDPGAARREAGATNSAAIIEDSDPRRRLALIAARFFGLQPKTVVAVTGTNGKTSVASFVRQLWAGQGFKAASLGTVGVVSSVRHQDPQAHHARSDRAARDPRRARQRRRHPSRARSLEPRPATAPRRRRHASPPAPSPTSPAIIWIITPSFEDYFAQKLRLFTELLPQGAVAVVDVDSEAGMRVAAVAEARGLKLLSVGRAGKSLRLVSAELDGFGQTLVIEHDGKQYKVRLPLVGAFQASNALVAAGLALATGANAATVLPMLASLQGARGRLDLAGTASGRRSDLHRLCPHARCARQGARCLAPLCGEPAARGVRLRRRPRQRQAARDGKDCRRQGRSCHRHRRQSAQRKSCRNPQPNLGMLRLAPSRSATARWRSARPSPGCERGDVLLVAGKGHETGQTIGATVIPFSDHDAVAAALKHEAKCG